MKIIAPNSQGIVRFIAGNSYCEKILHYIESEPDALTCELWPQFSLCQGAARQLGAQVPGSLGLSPALPAPRQCGFGKDA